MIYAVQVKTGKEEQVCNAINQRLKMPEFAGIRRKINKIILPVYKRIKYTPKGQVIERNKIFPGYIMISVARLSPEVWHFIAGFKIEGVLKILDTKPVTKEEYRKNRQKFRTVVSFETWNRKERLREIKQKIREYREKKYGKVTVINISLRKFEKIQKKLRRVFGDLDFTKLSSSVLLQKMAFVL